MFDSKTNVPFDTADYITILQPFLTTIVKATIMNFIVVAFGQNFEWTVRSTTKINGPF